MKNIQTIQGVLSIAAILCLVVGWFDILPKDISDFLSGKVFYVLIGISFILIAPFMTNRNLIYPMYAAGLMCIVGVFMPIGNSLSGIKSMGLLAGVIMSFFNRPRQIRN